MSINSLNMSILIGNVGRDPEIKTFPNGGRVANLSIATSEVWKDKATGERKEKTEWHRISVRNDGLVGIVEKYVHEGDKLAVIGATQTRNYDDKNGEKRYITEIILKGYSCQLILLSPKRAETYRGNADEEPGRSASGETSRAPVSASPAREPIGADDEDSIPF